MVIYVIYFPPMTSSMEYYVPTIHILRKLPQILLPPHIYLPGIPGDPFPFLFFPFSFLVAALDYESFEIRRKKNVLSLTPLIIHSL